MCGDDAALCQITVTTCYIITVIPLLLFFTFLTLNFICTGCVLGVNVIVLVSICNCCHLRLRSSTYRTMVIITSDQRPHHRRTRTVQSYSPGCAKVRSIYSTPQSTSAPYRYCSLLSRFEYIDRRTSPGMY